MRLILIRHGETEGNVLHQLDTAFPGKPLTANGQQQAEELVAKLAHEQIDALYASTLTRAQQTAAPLAQDRGLEVQVIDGIQEILAGEEELNTSWDRYVEELNSWSPDNLDSCIPGGETARQFLARYTGAVAAMEAAGHERVALVSHGAALRVWSIWQDPAIGFENAQPLRNTQWIVMNGSVETGFTIERWGDYLPPASANS